MTELIKISTHLSDDEKRIVKIYKDGPTYLVRCKNKSGSYFRTTFNQIDEAEDFAEDWVKKHE